MNIEHFILDNGLNVFLHENKEAPRFYAQIVINAGSKNDPSDASGIAHYLEHMMFKGSDDFGTSDFSKEKPLLDEITKLYDKRFYETNSDKKAELEKQINKLTVEASKYAIPRELKNIYSNLGGYPGAYTSNERTVYYTELPKNKLEQWAVIESNRFSNPVFRLFQSELKTIIEEKNKSLDNKERALYFAVEEQLYGRKSTLGDMEDIKNPSLSKMYDFFKTYYVPNNMAIIISGDIDKHETKKIIKKYFSLLEKREVPKSENQKEIDIKGVKKLTVNHKGEEKILIAFKTVPYKHEDRKALTIIDMILDSEEVGLIRLNLVNSQKLRNAGSYSMFRNDSGSESLYAILNSNQTHEEVEKMLLEQLEFIKQGQFDESILKSIILDFEIKQKKELESSVHFARIMADAFISDVSVEDEINFIDKLKKVTKEDIIKVANRYFTDNYVVAYRYNKDYELPKNPEFDLEKVETITNKTSAFTQKVEAMDIKPIKPKWIDYDKDFQVKSYAPNVLLYHVHNPLNDLFNLSITYEYGNKHNKNFAYLMDELNFSGIENLKAEEIKKEFFKIGINASYSCGDYSFSLNLSGLDSHLEKGLQLAEELLWNAKFDEKHLKDKIDNIISKRTYEKKDLETLKTAFIKYISFAKESPYIDRPKREDLLQININDYKKISEILQKQNFKIYYNGQFSIDKVESIIKKYHLPKNINKPLLNPRKQLPIKLSLKNDKAINIYFLDYRCTQSHIYLILPGEKFNAEESLINNLFNEYIKPIMSQEVRESRSLAYSTWAYYYQGIRIDDQDKMHAYIGTQTERTTEALNVFINILKNANDYPEHFERAKKLIENNLSTEYINFRTIIPAVEYWAERGFLEDPRAKMYEELNSITFDDLKAYINDKILSKNLTFAIIGNKKNINMDELKKIGNVKIISANSLFTNWENYKNETTGF